MQVVRSFLLILLGIAVLLSGCGNTADVPASAVLTAAPEVDPSDAPSRTTGDPNASTTATTVSQTTTTSASLEGITVPPSLEGLPLAVIGVDDELLVVAVADTGRARRQGLMNVADLVDLDGMLFVWSDDTDGGFWMKDTLLPLDIAFFSADGALVDSFPMEPCTSSPCPSYLPKSEYRYALETEQGRLGSLTAQSKLMPPAN